MAGAFRIAEGYVEVTADETAYDRAMARLKSKKHEVQVKVVLDDKDALARLARLTRDRMVRVLASADTRVAADEIRNLTRRQRVRIGVDVDSRVAADEINNLTRRRTVRVAADADTTSADARLRTLTRDRRVNVRVDVNRSALSMLSGLGGGGGGGAGGAGMMSSSIARLAAVAVGALPTLASLGQSMAAMGPAAAVAAPGVMSLASAVAAVKIGTSGIGDAFKAAFAPATSSGSAAASSTRAVEAAQRSLARAQQGVKDAEVRAAEARVQAARQIEDAQQNLKATVDDVADANRRAAERVQQAEQDLADAQRAAQRAQEDLTQARKEAARQLEDMNNRLIDSELDHREAVLRVQEAKEELDKTLADPKATQRERAEAQLTYDQAVQHLKEQELAQTRLKDEAAQANRAGAEGSKAVTDAQRSLADAQQNTRDKTRELKDAQIEAARTQVDGAQKIAKAQRDVADAHAAAAKAARDGARGIADAQQAVADAARAVTDAQLAGAAAVDKLSTAMAKLSPNARDFVDSVRAMAPAWRELRLDVQDALFQGLGRTFMNLSTAVLPSLRTGLTGTASVLNLMAKSAAQTFTGLAQSGTLSQMFAGVNEGLKPLVRVPGQIVEALVRLSVAASPAFQRLTSAAGAAMDRISQRMSATLASGAMEESINRAIGVAKDFGRLLGDFFGTLGNVMKAAAAGGGNALGTIGTAFAELRRITAMPEVQRALTSIFTAINAVARLITGALGQAIQGILPALVPIADAITGLITGSGNLLPLVGALLLRFNPVLGVITALAPVMSQLSAALTPLISAVVQLASQMLVALQPAINAVMSVITQIVTAVSGPLSAVISALIPLVQPVLGIALALINAFLPLLPALLQLLPPLGQLTVALLTLTLTVIQPLLPLINLLAGLLSTVLTGAVSLLVPALIAVTQGITLFVNAITAGVNWVVDKFRWLYDVLVGHSIIPDLVNAIITWFKQLGERASAMVRQMATAIVDTWRNLWSAVGRAWDAARSYVVNSVSSALSWIRSAFSSLRSTVSSIWSELWGSVRDRVSSIFSTIGDKVSSFKSGMKSAFSSLRDSLGSIWDGVRSKIGSPIKWVVGAVYNDGIRRMWNTIAGKISSRITLPAIGLGFNQGGVVPGTGNTDTVPAMLTPGERVLSLAQVARLGGHKAIDAAVGRGTGSAPFFAGGGIVDNIVSGASGLAGRAWDWTKDVVRGGLAEAADTAIRSVVRPLINAIPMGSGQWAQTAKGVPTSALEKMTAFLKHDDKEYMDSIASQIGNVPGALKSWIAAALAITKTPASWAGPLSVLVMRESGGNPNAMNAWDSNAAQGYDMRSKGLAQTIGPTFRAYHQPGTSWNIFDPVANLAAALNYIKGRYGSIFNVQQANANLPPKGYDRGGLLQPGATLAVNSSGRPEAVLTADETAKFQAIVNGLGTGMTIQTLTVNIEGTFDLSSPAERKRAAEAMVVEIKDALRNYDRGRA
ncbi:transglycosylase SLT domain-containing protein [Streptomyces cinnamoneus]|uniref:transglycosylase SLT domain-containing protein n=1 Tax=Streptomyces cinnamoneus TaxID=53446 RepID=UPI00340BED17